MNYKLKKDIVIKAGTIFKEDKELPENAILDLEIEDKEGLLLGTVYVYIADKFKDNWESWLEPESVNTHNMLQLRKMPAIAPLGQNQGIFASISVEPGQNATGNECQVLKVEVELEIKNAQGVPYTVTKQYNLNKGGVALFQKDFASWSGRELTDVELAQFDADKLMKNKSVLVEIKHKGDGKKATPVIEKFLPIPDPVTLSP